MSALVPFRSPLTIPFQELNPLTNATQIMIRQKGKIVKRMTNKFLPVIKTKEGVDYSVQHREEEGEEVKWGHPVAIAIMMVQDYMTTSIYQKHQIALFVLKKIQEYDKPLLFGVSNYKNFYNE